MKRLYIAVLIFALLALGTGIGTALAGGSSDSSGDGFHCYMFFTLPDGKFAQVMVNDSDPAEVIKKVDELLEKYQDDEDGVLDLSIGNIEGTVCAPKLCLTCEEKCELEAKTFLEECIALGSPPEKCKLTAESRLRRCLKSCGIKK